MQVDVVCIGHASYDLVFQVDHHPEADEKCTASGLISCGGGPAANAAVTVARLARRAAFVGYLGRDFTGQAHFQELLQEGVETAFVCRGDLPTPLSVVLVKPDGLRALINYRGATQPLAADAVDLGGLETKVALFDGHEPYVSCRWLGHFRRQGSATVLDAGSLHPGTQQLMFEVDYLIASRKFAAQWLGQDDPERALQALAARSPAVVITLGEAGLIWQRGNERGALPAFPVQAVDTTGAGDIFHGAFAAALVAQLEWLDALRFAAASAALSCTKLGARPAIPRLTEVEAFLASQGSI